MTEIEIFFSSNDGNGMFWIQIATTFIALIAAGAAWWSNYQQRLSRQAIICPSKDPGEASTSALDKSLTLKMSLTNYGSNPASNIKVGIEGFAAEKNKVGEIVSAKPIFYKPNFAMNSLAHLGELIFDQSFFITDDDESAKIYLVDGALYAEANLFLCQVSYSDAVLKKEMKTEKYYWVNYKGKLSDISPHLYHLIQNASSETQYRSLKSQIDKLIPQY